MDEAGFIWGRIGRELTGVLFVINYVLCTGSGIIGISTALNAFSNHAACTVWYSFVGFVLTTIISSIRTWGKMTWPLTIAFVSVIAGVLVVVIGVAFPDRPAAAPQTGKPVPILSSQSLEKNNSGAYLLNRPIRFRLRGDRAPKLHRGYRRLSHHIRLQCSRAKLPLDNCRDEETAGLQESCLPSGYHCRSGVPFFLDGHLLLLWEMDCNSFTGECWSVAEKGRVRCCVS